MLHQRKPIIAIEAALRVLQYLVHTADEGITYSKDNPGILEAYTDSDFAKSSTGRSVTGGIVLYGGAPVAWVSRLSALP